MLVTNSKQFAAHVYLDSLPRSLLLSSARWFFSILFFLPIPLLTQFYFSTDTMPCTFRIQVGNSCSDASDMQAESRTVRADQGLALLVRTGHTAASRNVEPPGATTPQEPLIVSDLRRGDKKKNKLVFPDENIF
jgi:hypothetical protein